MKKISAPHDYTPISLPHNRKAQFSDILKHRYMLLILNAIFIFIGFSPLIFMYSFTVYISNASVFEKLIESFNVDASQQAFVYFWTMNLSYLIMIPLTMLAFVFLAGGLRVYRMLSWSSGVFFFHDFFKGIKSNFKQGLIVGFLISLYIFISKFSGGAITIYVNPNFGIGYEIFLKAVLIIMILPIGIISMIVTTYFNEKFFSSIKNSFYIYSSKALFFLLLSVLILIVYVFPYIGNVYLILIAICLIMLFVMPIYVLCWNQIALNSLDIYGTDKEAKLKGLYDPSKYINKNDD